MTIEQLQARLREAEITIGEGRLSMSIGQADQCFVTHWHRTGPAGYEDCKTVGVGTVSRCLDAMERYVSAYRRPPTTEEVGRMLGLTVEQPAPSYALAAE